MKIGVDAYYLFAPHIDGLGNYLLRLLAELSRIDAENEYYLYAPGITHTDYADIIFSNRRFMFRKVSGIFTANAAFGFRAPR